MAHAGNLPWTPSGDAIVYASPGRDGNLDIFSKPSNGGAEARLLVGTPLRELAPDWSPGQRFLIYVAASSQNTSQVLYRERGPDGTLGEPVTFVNSSFNEGEPRFSPDGRFVAYSSNESGRFEVYVRDFPKGTQKWQISHNGGRVPRWRRDGKELFYADQRRLMAVRVATASAFSAGTPVLLFERRLARPVYNVSADGKRFVILDPPASEPPLSIHVVHNWFEEFRGRQQERTP